MRPKKSACEKVKSSRQRTTREKASLSLLPLDVLAFDFETDWWNPDRRNNTDAWMEDCDGRVIQVGYVGYWQGKEIIRECHVVKPMPARPVSPDAIKFSTALPANK